MAASSRSTPPATEARPTLRDLPPAGWPRLWTLLRRAVGRRCPQCGASGIFATWFSVKERCPRCGFRFERESGYFLGAYALNLIVAEVLGLGLVLVLLFRSDFSLLAKEAIAIPAAVILPLLFFPYSRTLWMTLDLMLDRSTGERQLRGDEVRQRPGEGD